jgi:hypothetical protein
MDVSTAIASSCSKHAPAFDPEKVMAFAAEDHLPAIGHVLELNPQPVIGISLPMRSAIPDELACRASHQVSSPSTGSCGTCRDGRLRPQR